MRNINNLFAGILISVTAITACGGCGIKHDAKMQGVISKADKIDTPLNDTIGNKYSADAKYFETTRELNLAKDSLDVLRDSLDKVTLNYIKVIKSKDSITKINISNKEKLGVAEYKLIRIREYNRIAAQGNNLKYLRGWIKRVID